MLEAMMLVGLGLMAFAAFKALKEKGRAPYYRPGELALGPLLERGPGLLELEEELMPLQPPPPAHESWDLPPGSIIRLGPDGAEIVQPIVLGLPAELPLAELNGWYQVADADERPKARGRGTTLLRGFYKAEGRSFLGEIEIENKRIGRMAYPEVRYFIYDPPPSVRRHPKWPCFFPDFHKGAGWYRVNIVGGFEDVNIGIGTIQKILSESLFSGQKGGRRGGRKRLAA